MTGEDLMVKFSDLQAAQIFQIPGSDHETTYTIVDGPREKETWLDDGEEGEPLLSYGVEDDGQYELLSAPPDLEVEVIGWQPEDDASRA